LAVGSAIRLFALRESPADVVQQRLGSLKVWWLLAFLWSAALMVGVAGVALLLAAASFLGLREFLRLLGTNQYVGRPAIAGLIAMGIIHYGLIVAGAGHAARMLFPIVVLIGLATIRALTCHAQDYIRVTAGLFWGAMLMIYGLSHSLFFFDSVTTTEPLAGTVGWVLFVVLLTEINDIMQALVGRKFGNRKITPEISPQKTLEGLVGGIVSTVIVALVLAPFLTTMTLDRGRFEGWMISAAAGGLIAFAGFLGDINMSAVKRDVGVKDGSSLLPGMGGMIDRIDSMTFTGPAFYYFVMLVSSSGSSN
jgi:phosphatidate cytidylyltransferase